MPIHMKENICAALVRLLDHRDIRKITVKDLVQECAISRQSFYYHFRDLQEVIRFVIRHELRSRFRPEDGIDALCTALAELAYSDLLGKLLADRDASAERALLDEICALLSDLLQMPTSQFRVPISDAAVLAEFCGCGIVGLMLRSRRWEISDPTLLAERLRQALSHIRVA
ncbi:MAG: TetR family transcriptional regulator [Clostridia bacterium]|nr:TetR family transcriptional regulator [Clostridia bacterium]